MDLWRKRSVYCQSTSSYTGRGKKHEWLVPKKCPRLSPASPIALPCGNVLLTHLLKDVASIHAFIQDLSSVGFQFPSLLEHAHFAADRQQSQNRSCRTRAATPPSLEAATPVPTTSAAQAKSAPTFTGLVAAFFACYLAACTYHGANHAGRVNE